MLNFPLILFTKVPKVTKMSLLRKLIEGKLVDTFLFLFLLSGGIIENEKYVKFESLYSAIVTSVSCVEMLGCSVGFVNAAEFAHRIEILVQVSAHVYLLSLHWIVKSHRKSLLICAQHLRGDSQGIGEEASQLTEQLFRKILVVVLSVFILFLSMIAFTSIFIPLLTDFDFKDKYIYVMPFWFTCTDSGHSYFPIKGLCWNIDSYFKYFAMNSLEIALFSVEVFVHITSFVFYTCVQTHTVAHVKTIGSKIERMRKQMVTYERNDEQRCSVRETVRREGVLYGELLDIVKYHQFIFKVEANIIPFLCWIVTASLSIFCAVSTLSAFLIVTEAKSEFQKQGEMMFRMKLGSAIANLALMFFLYCRGAEVTLHVNEDIHDAIYSTPWYSQSVKFKKLVISFMVQIQKALHISALGMYKLNLNFFMTVCRTIYSSLNMLMAFTDTRRM